MFSSVLIAYFNWRGDEQRLRSHAWYMTDVGAMFWDWAGINGHIADIANFDFWPGEIQIMYAEQSVHDDLDIVIINPWY